MVLPVFSSLEEGDWVGADVGSLVGAWVGSVVVLVVVFLVVVFLVVVFFVVEDVSAVVDEVGSSAVVV